MGVAVTRNAPKYWGFREICVNPVSRHQCGGEGSGEQGGSHVPSVLWLPRLGPCPQCCPPLRDRGWAQARPGPSRASFKHDLPYSTTSQSLCSSH